MAPATAVPLEKPLPSTPTERNAPPRIVLAKVGLDGHDRGIRVVARGLRDAGFHVIYGGLWQRPEAVAQAVCDEDADWLGLSLLSGAHLTIVPRVAAALREWGCGDVGIVVGGIIPERDVAGLKEHGVRGVFGPGTSMAAIAEALKTQVPLAAPLIDHASEEVRTRVEMSRRLSAIAAGDSLATSTRNGQRSRCIAITGSPGAGKSSLLCRLLKGRPAGKRVAVLACDPESPLTGGALLGDRIRMAELLPDRDLFVRSLAVPSGSQGVTPELSEMRSAFGEAGFDLTLVETVGIGQGDVAVRRLADKVVVVLQPETGDSVQWEKAGLLEVADLVVIQKSDLPGSDRLAAEVHEALNLFRHGPEHREVPVLRVSASRNEGFDALREWIFETSQGSGPASGGEAIAASADPVAAGFSSGWDTSAQVR